MKTRATATDAYQWTAPIVNRAYVPNRLNQYASVAGVTFSHELNGNLTSDGARSFSYDVENRLTSVSGGASLSLAYDPLGRLKQTTAGVATTEYLYEGDRLIAEYSGAALLRRYAHGAGVDEPLVWYEGAALSDKRWLHADERGSIIATSDAAGAGTIYSYGPYGEPAAWTGARFRYTGQIALPEVQLYHYKARVYDPSTGRFLQTDPVGYKDDLNLYAYVRNDPLNNTDPTGKFCESGGTCAMYHDDMAVLGGEMTTEEYGDRATARGVGAAAAAVVVAAVVATRGAVLEALAGIGDSDTQTPPDQNSGNQDNEDIYVVPGEGTPSGRDYVGRTGDRETRFRNSSDGRDRSKAQVVKTVEKSEARKAEQQEMNDRGGVDNLDNKRNEVAPCKWPDCGIRPPGQ